MKVSELFEALEPLNESASDVRKSVVTALKSMGYTQKSQESSPGALKAWLKPAEPKQWDAASFKKMISDLNSKASLKLKVVAGYDENSYDAIGGGIEIAPQGSGTLFIAVSRKGTAGDDYRGGKDT